MSQTDPSNDDNDTKGGQISEGGAGALNAETAGGGADSVPDTPDNTPADSDDTPADAPE